MSAIRARSNFPSAMTPPQSGGPQLARPLPSCRPSLAGRWNNTSPWKRLPQTKFEYLDGEIYCMSGGTNNHSEIAANVTIEIGGQIRGSDCSTRTSDMRLKISASKYVYPDLSIVCGKAQLEDNDTTLLNPMGVIEVVSPSSAAYDREIKLDFYRSLPSVAAYLIVDQSQYFVELHTRTESGWHWQTFSDLAEVIPLEAIGVNLPLSEIYRGIAFEAA